MRPKYTFSVAMGNELYLVKADTETEAIVITEQICNRDGVRTLTIPEVMACWPTVAPHLDGVTRV